MNLPIFRLRLLAFLFLAVALSSCLTIKEHYQFKKNGSGSMSFLVEMDPIDAGIGGMTGNFIPEEWSFEGLASTVKTIPGISKVELIDMAGNRGTGISFSFDNPDALNRALSRMLLSDSTEVFPYFRQEYGVWVHAHKSDKISLSEAFFAKSRDEDQVAALMKQLDYEISMEFKKPVAVAYSEAEGTITGKKNRTFLMRSTLQDISRSSDALSATILLD